MSTNKNLLAKGLKYLFGALPLMFLGPSVFYNALMNKHTNWHYVILVLGCVICITSVVLAFKGLQTLMKALFDGNPR
ncbi:MAG: hypothetical protein RLZZ500_1200 [Bacteroidota bacterium]|jgi:hypothetical protein